MTDPGAAGKEKWYFKTSSIVIAFLCVGPFALPLVWFNPKISTAKKIVFTAVILILTYFLSIYMMESIKKILEQYKQLSASL